MLCKYQGREEEFLQFVVQKYSVAPELLIPIIEAVLPKFHPMSIVPFVYKKPVDPDADEKASSRSGNGKSNMVPRPPDGSKTKGVGNGSASTKRQSRSLSPPGVATSSRASASWKGGTAEEEEAFREEVIAAHVPKDDDEWMLFEMKHLHQFTRIFPAVAPAGKSETGLSEQEANEMEAKEEQDDDQDNDKDDGDSVTRGKSTAVAEVKKPAVKISSFVDIMVQVIMRLLYCLGCLPCWVIMFVMYIV